MNVIRADALHADPLRRLRRDDAELRTHHVRVRAWAMSRGRPLDADALAVVIGTVLGEQRRHGFDPTEWTAERVTEFMWTTCLRWCLEQGVQPSEHIAGALAAWWEHLADTGTLHPDSHQPSTLRAALAACSAPRPRKASRRTHPSAGPHRRREHQTVR